MSGIVGLLRHDGGRVCERTLQRLTHRMAGRGPDRQSVWQNDAVGLGHALLRTRGDADGDDQPAGLHDRLWIAADARLDDRAALVRRLEPLARRDLAHASDARLILHAYDAWGERCVDALFGDFAFVLWDAPRRRLFCARDHFGVKPFYYAELPDGAVVGNTLACLRLHPGVDDSLDQTAVGDFLLFGFNQNPATTTFAGIRRLPPAHVLTWDGGRLSTRRYWTVPTTGRLRYARARDYVDHFAELLRAAVADRLPGGRVGVWMSGGLDSTAVAAAATQVLDRSAGGELRAHATVFDTLLPDDERRYATLAAEALDIPVSWLAADAYRPFDGWSAGDLDAPEPTDDPFRRLRRAELRDSAAFSRVALCGEGGDEILRAPRLAALFGRYPARELVGDVARSVFVHRRRPALGLRERLAALRPRDAPPFPRWLDPAFASRTGLRERWSDAAARGRAHGGTHGLAAATWAWYFESLDPGATGVPIEVRCPFLDVRVAAYALAIPPLPWCIDKHLLRLAMRGSLPEAVRLRPKTPLAGDPLRAHILRGSIALPERFEPTRASRRFIDWSGVSLAPGPDDDPWLALRPPCLDAWLRHASGEETDDGQR